MPRIQGAVDMMFFKEIAEETEKATTVRRAVIYARYSSEMQDTSDSIEVQVSACQKYAVTHGIAIVCEPFIDRAETGTSTENRSSYQCLMVMAQAADRDFNTILTFHTSRWGRGIQSEIDEFLLEKSGVKIIAVSQPFTADDAIESVFMKGILRKIDAFYSAQASKYTHAYQKSNAENGFKNGGAAPDGYCLESVPTGKRDKHGREKMKSRLAIDLKPGKYDLTSEPRHKLIELVFAHAAAGKGIKWLAREIFKLGWRSRYADRPICFGTIRTWLINPAYAGFMVWNRVKFFRREGKRSYRVNPVHSWVYSDKPSHPAIVDKDVFEKIALKYLKNIGHGTHHKRDHKGEMRDSGRYLLSGMMDCGVCGSKYVAAMTVHTNKPTPHVYFYCNNKLRNGKVSCASKPVNLAVAEGVIMHTLVYTLLTEEEIKKFIQAFNEFAETDTEEFERKHQELGKQMEGVRKEMAHIKRAVFAGADPRSFVEDLQDRQQILDRLQKELGGLKQGETLPPLFYEPGRFKVWAESLKDYMLSADFDLRRELLRRFVKKIVINADRTASLTWDPAAILQIRPVCSAANNGDGGAGDKKQGASDRVDQSEAPMLLTNSVAGVGFEPTTFGL